MANWKLTPFPIGGCTIGIIPEWTSGAGCYRVKRFSSKFPLFLHGAPTVIESSRQLIRWSSKEIPEQDVAVLIKFSGRLLKLFSAQSFVVEFFKRLWSRTNISDKLIFIKNSDLDGFCYKKDIVLSDQIAIVNLFVNASSRMGARAIRSSENSALHFFYSCKELKKTSRRDLATLVDPLSLVALTEGSALLFKVNPLDVQVKLKTTKPLPLIPDRHLTKKNNVLLKKIKQLNVERSRVILSVEDKKSIKEARDAKKNDNATTFKEGKIVYLTSNLKYFFKVNEFGSFYILTVFNNCNGVVCFIPFLSKRSASDMIDIMLKSTFPESNNLCLKMFVGDGVYETTQIARLSNGALEFFLKHWSGTPIGYSSYTTSIKSKINNSSKQLVSKICSLTLSSRFGIYSSFSDN